MRGYISILLEVVWFLLFLLCIVFPWFYALKGYIPVHVHASLVTAQVGAALLKLERIFVLPPRNRRLFYIDKLMRMIDHRKCCFCVCV